MPDEQVKIQFTMEHETGLPTDYMRPLHLDMVLND